MPTHAVTLTIPMVFSAYHLSVFCPEERKAKAVKATMSEPVGNGASLSGTLCAPCFRRLGTQHCGISHSAVISPRRGGIGHSARWSFGLGEVESAIRRPSVGDHRLVYLYSRSAAASQAVPPPASASTSLPSCGSMSSPQ